MLANGFSYADCCGGVLPILDSHPVWTQYPGHYEHWTFTYQLPQHWRSMAWWHLLLRR